MSPDAGINKRDLVEVQSFDRAHTDLFGRDDKGETLREGILKMMDPEEREESHSDQGVQLGEKMHPFNMAAAIDFKNQNPHHSTCIETKSRSTCGLGFVDQEAVEDILDGLCEETFQSSVLNPIVEDYWQVGNGYIEVVRKKGKIVGLYHVPAASVRICVNSQTYERCFLVQGEVGVMPKLLAPFGELEYFLNRHRTGGKRKPKKGETETPTYAFGSFATVSERSEIIHFRRATSMSRWYGYPDWLSAIPHVELVQMLVQEKFDFFLNRGVPEFMLFILSRELGAENKKKIEDGIRNTLGQGNQHKTMLVNIHDPDVKVQLEKLAMETKGDVSFAQMSETLALDIVTAHRTPPVLAGITIPGKLGATNELPNALMAFQTLVIGPEQHTISSILSATLGNQKKNGGLKTRRKHFVFKTIVQEIPAGLGQQQPGAGGPGDTAGMKAMDTVARSRTPIAADPNRDLSAGVKKEDGSEAA